IKVVCLLQENEYDVAELTEALLLIKKRKSNGELGFLQEGVQEEQDEVQELRAAHAETIQELQKTRSLLSMESSICRDYKVELQAVLQKMEADGGGFAQQLQRQAALLDTRAARIKKLEGRY
ncbi:protein fantom-like, partial [Notothenia coriiceps]|uniref:Protein fantom-like n=1 Tax=Notothenia coriiceps TaxID=8208 RepID=A0A6I9PSG3_9TELE